MHPAPSIIVFTVLSGLGYGLAAVLCLGLLDPAAIATKLGWVLALGLIATGLLASTFHLGNPQRAWRALSQWRSSWLSREGVSAIVTFVPLLWVAWAGVIEGRNAPVVMALGALGCLVTVWCTSMIYAQLRTVDAWHTPLTTACFLLFALSGGLTFAAFADVLGAGNYSGGLALAAFVANAAAWFLKLKWRARLARPALSTPETATGLGGIGKVRLFEPPHMTDNYLTREMVFRIGRKHAGKIFRLALVLGGVVPGLLLLCAGLAGSASAPIMALLLFLAATSHIAGILCERWLFFAEARHAVSAYYGS